MHQTAKRKQLYFGMKAHIGVDSRMKLIHTISAFAAGAHDAEALPYLFMWGGLICLRPHRRG
jgi:IS5 family transposase